MITTGISWRAALIFQALVIVTIILLSRRLEEPLPPDQTRRFDVVGPIVSAVGMFFVVLGILQAETDAVLFVVFLAVGLSDLASGNPAYALAMAVLAGLAFVGLAAAMLLPGQLRPVGLPAAEAA